MYLSQHTSPNPPLRHQANRSSQSPTGRAAGCGLTVAGMAWPEESPAASNDSARRQYGRFGVFGWFTVTSVGAGTSTITIADKKPFQDAVKPVWEKYGAKYAGLIQRIRNTK